MRVTLDNVLEQVAMFRDEIGKMSADKLAMEQRQAAKDMDTKTAIKALQHDADNNKSEMQNINKENERIWEEASRLQRAIDSTYQKSSYRIDDLKDNTLKWCQDLQG